MTKRITLKFALTASLAGILTGCMPDMANMEMSPQRPPELEQLNAFVGNWTGEMEMTLVGSDEVMKASGTSESKWEGDGWYLVNRMVADMGEMGQMKALETWVYDPGSKLFRTTWVDNVGGFGTGTARYHEQTNTWHVKAKTYNPMFGRTTAKGTIRVIDDNTMEWDWAEYTMFGLKRITEMSGTNRRQ